MLLRLNWPSSTSPGNRHQPAAQPRPLKVAEARKSACASPSRRSLCRKPQDHVGMTLPRPRIALSFATTPRGSQIRRSPRLLVCRKPTLSTGIAPAMASNASWEMAILTMTPDMGTPRASRQSTRGLTRTFAGRIKCMPSRLGGPPGCSGSKSHANPDVRAGSRSSRS